MQSTLGDQQAILNTMQGKIISKTRLKQDTNNRGKHKNVGHTPHGWFSDPLASGCRGPEVQGLED